MTMKRIFALLVIGCNSQPVTAKKAQQGSVVSVENSTDSSTTVYFSFGADSKVLPANWQFCTTTAKLNCNFQLLAHGTQALPLDGQYLNATISFGSEGCNATKAELNVNNPKWYDTLDISLVDGYSNNVQITSDSTKLGPVLGKTGNEKILGVFPYGCDICTARQSPPCGIPTGKDGCKAGTQYKPDVPCQFQGPIMGGGSIIKISLVK